MARAASITDSELEEQFRDDPEFAIELLHEEFQERIASYLKRATRGLLGPEDLADLYQETMVAVLETARSAQFDPREPWRIIRTIARNTGVDALRRQRTFPERTNEDDMITAVAADLRGTNVGTKWTGMSSEEKTRFAKVLVEIVSGLPERQRVVAVAFVANFEDFRERRIYEPLAKAVSAMTGQRESVVAVKSAWRFARERIREGLVRRGFDFAKRSAL
jgi:RNA polymerase sigma factor (sigma-70 family)